jgi:hypothetical protein
VIDLDSDTWDTLKRWAHGELKRHMTILTASGVDQRAADEARGAMHQVHALLDLEKPKAPLSEPAREYRGDRSGY